MISFKKQEGYCSICGKKDNYEFKSNRSIVCSEDCRKEFDWRYALYVMGKDYYQHPQLNYNIKK